MDVKYHLVGIGGIGMSGLARILLQSKCLVSGSDAKSGEILENLKEMGALISIGHDPKHIPEGSSVVVSSGIKASNPEIVHAKSLNLPILHRSDLLHVLMQGQKPLLVAGTHGKTTTTSLLTTVFLKKHPSYAIGGVLSETGQNASRGDGDYFIAEADESDGSFLRYEPFGAIITNLNHDHMDYYKTEENLIEHFQKFAGKVAPKWLFYCGEDENLKKCHVNGTSYGFFSGADLQGLNFRQEANHIFFDAAFEGKKYLNIEVPLSGYHNALNTLAVFGLAIRAGLNENDIKEALGGFQGVKRRAEKIGEVNGVLILDDYGHHPKEIQTTLQGLKNAYPYRRLVVLFQPHRYTRARDCFKEYGKCFDAADQVIMTDIYGAGEDPIPGVTAEALFREIQDNSKSKITYVPRESLASHSASFSRPFDLIVTLGAGDITQLGPEILHSLQKKPPQKIKLGLLFGGESGEHEISLRSSKYILKNLDPNIFDVKPFYISKKGHWSASQEIVESKERISAEVFKEIQGLDCVFPVLHGTFGEDGTIQGFFEMLALPYVGCGYQSSAICMDKAVTKKVVAEAGLAVAPFIDFSEHAWRHNQDEILQKIESKLHFPLYVKPVHLGSTIGVKKVKAVAELIEAIHSALQYDNHILVEKEIVGREIEFSVFGDGRAETLPPGEILSSGQTYDYEAKYGKGAFPVASKADLSFDLIETGMDFAKKAYLACGCDGFARVDLFLEPCGKYYLNEINPIPGFQELSVYPKCFEANGVPMKSHLNTLVSIALARHRNKRKKVYGK